MIKVIDKVNGHLIQKVLHNKTGALVRYQAVPENKVGDYREVACYSTLADARTYAAINSQGKETI